jgi:hypothetical protein
MAQNSVQFQKGMSITEFLVAFGDEAKCFAAVVAARVTDRRNGATDVRRNGARNRWVKRRPEGVKTGLILQPFEDWI